MNAPDRYVVTVSFTVDAYTHPENIADAVSDFLVRGVEDLFDTRVVSTSHPISVGIADEDENIIVPMGER